ncbi:MAG: MBL fold metallo-hydrolase [Actinomycetota bacterium]
MSLEIFGHLVVGPLACNCYVVGDPDTKEAIVIDPGGDSEAISELLVSNELTVTQIVATHAHFDHIVAAQRLRELTGAAFRLHASDNAMLDWYQESALLFLGTELPPPPDVDSPAAEGDTLAAGGVVLEVLHTPGHSPGSIALVSDEAVFTGDTLFAGSVGRTDLPGGDTDALVRAVKEKLFALETDLPAYPGHGPATTLGEERRFNPFVGAASRLWVPPD